MRLNGVISPDRPLLVVALEEEAAYLDDRWPVLLTGMGKVNAATALAATLARQRPSAVINLGTAGALRPEWTGTHEVGHVTQHDLDTAFLEVVTGHRRGLSIELSVAGPVLATGDIFVADEVDRERLARHADLVDMEGYALAVAAERAHVPLRIVKQISDGAEEAAVRTWRESVDNCAKALAAWVDAHLS